VQRKEYFPKLGKPILLTQHYILTLE